MSNTNNERDNERHDDIQLNEQRSIQNDTENRLQDDMQGGTQFVDTQLVGARRSTQFDTQDDTKGDTSSGTRSNNTRTDITRIDNSHTDSHADNSRLNAILDATIECFGRFGYYGTSLQRIADAVGLTKAGVLHYAGSKEGLLALVLTERYDRETESIMEGMITEDRPLIAEMWRRTVAINSHRPALVHMFSTLSAEALDPEHPAHEYFARREQNIVSNATNINWHVPDGVNIKHVLQAGFSMMDGLQLRWLRTPGQDLNAMWADCEDALLPLPLWENYR